MASHTDIGAAARATERPLTRRAFSGVALGSISSVAVGLRGVANAELINPTAEPEGPDHLIPEC